MSSVVAGINNKDKKYRSRNELIAAILKAAGMTGTLKSKIMFKAYLSYTELKLLVDELIRLRLLEYDKDTRLYRCNAKGLRFLELYGRLREEFKELE